ncbi:tetratricopeptide repeat protein [Capnocytophaga sputigena]|uniref:tetratricopeptide repeat protein n=1 Tax=Capnocytophaga sputigena TaxID=1019 RepID=UPI0028F15057|nr:tetratricopeptide repeat protein [Capnocytophaga sputigena]
MATYKKNNNRPNRNRNTEQLDEAQEAQLHQESTTAEVFDALDAGANRTEDWVKRNQKIIIGVLVAVAVVGLGYLLYQQFVKAPNEKKAANELFFAQQFFDEAMQATDVKAKDSLFKVSIDGGKGKYGFKQIAQNYSGTKAANLAEYGMGMAYMRLGDYNNAINHLKEFNSDDDIFGALAYGNIGDAYLQQKNNAEALKYYIKAFEHSNNDFVTPIYLKKAGIVASLQGKKDDALKYYERIKDEFPTSEEARTIDILIGKISQ